MTEQRRPQSRMVPVMIAALVGVLLGALGTIMGVLAGQRGNCCCCSGSVAVTARDSRAPVLPPPSQPIPRQEFFILPNLPDAEVPVPGPLMLVGAGLIAWRLS